MEDGIVDVEQLIRNQFLDFSCVSISRIEFMSESKRNYIDNDDIFEMIENSVNRNEWTIVKTQKLNKLNNWCKIFIYFIH